MIARRIVCSKKLLVARKFSRSSKGTWNGILRDNYKTSLERFMKNHQDVVNAILKNTKITRDHLTPELRLFLLTDNCSLYHEPFIDENGNGRYDSLTRNVFHEPFWSIYWPGGQALTRFILDEKERILGDATQDAKKCAKILDLGAGCGATAIAARSIGPWKVVANDINKVACVAIAMNATLNDVDIEVSCRNLLEKPQEEPYSVIFVGDLLYDEEMTSVLIAWLENAYARDAQIYLGDPGRHGLTEDLKRRMRLLRRYTLPENVRKENHGYDAATVWQFVSESK